MFVERESRLKCTGRGGFGVTKSSGAARCQEGGGRQREGRLQPEPLRRVPGEDLDGVGEIKFIWFSLVKHLALVF